jgi:lipopolysaccharide biosynthesis regulator YciM
MEPMVVTAIVAASVLATAAGLAGLLRLRGGARPAARRWPGGPLSEAMRALLDDDLDRARAVLQEAVRDGAPEPGIYLALGAVLRRAGDPERAAAVHRGLTVRAGLEAGVRAEAHLQVALDLLAAGQPSEALEAAQRALAILPDDPDLLALDRDAAYEAGDFDHALGSHQRWVRVTGAPSSRIEAVLLAARSEAGRRGGERAHLAKDLKRALKVDPECARARLLQAREASEAGDAATAAAMLQALRADQPGLDGLVLPPLAEALHSSKSQAALDEIREAATAAADHPSFRCSHCDEGTAEVRWRCRNCGAWEAWASA